MVSIADYSREHNSELDAYEIKCNEQPICPDCHQRMSYRDSRKRICRHRGGETLWYIVSRFLCRCCNHLHTALPDFLVPHKHYAAEEIREAVDGYMTSEDVEALEMSYPVDITIERWKRWYSQNETNIEGHLRRVSYQINDCQEESLSISVLGEVRKKIEKWLETVLRIIYNSGGCLAPLGA